MTRYVESAGVLPLTLLALIATSPLACSHPQAAGPKAGAKGAQSFRDHPPAPGPQPHFEAPVPQRTRLKNGLTLLVTPKTDLPLVHLEIVVRTGSAADPKDMEGLAGFVADMLKAGTTSRSAQQVADQIETYGTSLHVAVGEDSTVLFLTTLKNNFTPVFAVVADVIQHPAFAKKEIERLRKQRLAALDAERDDASETASRVFRRAIYDDTPYGHSPLGTEAGIKKIDAAALHAFFAAHFGPANAAVILTGDISPDAAQAAVTKRLGSWSGKAAVEPPPQPPKGRRPVFWLVDKPGAPQSQLRIGELGVARNTPDYFPLVMMNAILGGLFNSRINMNLREDKGYTYGARSYFDFSRGVGPFVVYTGVRTNVTAPSVHEVLEEIHRMVTTNVSTEELTNAKDSYSRSLPGYFQTVGNIGSMVANIYLFSLPLDYYRQVPSKLASVTIADVRRVAESHLHPDELSIVVVGDKEKVQQSLAELGRGAVQLRDPNGAPF